MDTIKYPGVTVKLIGDDGNVFAVIGRVSGAITTAIGPEASAAFRAEALRQDSYDAVLQLVMATVEVE